METRLHDKKRDIGRASGDKKAREFDSWISRKVLAGLIKPAFFYVNFYVL